MIADVVFSASPNTPSLTLPHKGEGNPAEQLVRTRSPSAPHRTLEGRACGFNAFPAAAAFQVVVDHAH